MASTTVRRALDYAFAGVLLAFPAALVHSSFKQPGDLNVLDRIVLKVSSPLQALVGWTIDGVGALWNRYVWLVDVDEENAELRRENERLRLELAEARRAAADVERLEELAGLRRELPADTLGARVVATGLNPYFRVTRVTLDRGAPDVKEGMAVIAPDGIVGRIHRVYGRYADVLLAVDPQSSIDVVVPRTGARGIVKGLGGDNAYGARIDYLLRTEDVKKGDLVVTSGLGGIFPRDVPVGRIKKIVKPPSGLYYQEVEVEPSVDFARLSKVLVVLAPPPPPDPTARQRKVPEPAFGVAPAR